MSTTLHPEEALDRAVAGTLSSREQEELERHVAACLACAAHLALARSARTIHAPQPWDSGLNRIVVGNTLASLNRTRWSTTFSALARRRWAFLTAGTLFALGSVSSAAWWHTQRASNGGTVVPIATAPTSMPAPAHRKYAPAPSEAPTVPSLAIPDQAVTPIRGGRTQATAAALFEEASSLRNRDRPDQAIVVFRRLQRLYPRARETRLSFALAGRLLLDRGRPAQALSQFDRHLALGGEATEEALAGRAAALGGMGHLSAEGETWRRLLRVYPKSVYANQARERLSQMAGSSQAPAGIAQSRSASGIPRDRSTDPR